MSVSSEKQSAMRGKLWGVVRNWHIWIGVASAIPILIIAVSTIFLVHKSLDFHIPNVFAAVTDAKAGKDKHGKWDDEIAGLEKMLAQADGGAKPGKTEKTDKPEKTGAHDKKHDHGKHDHDKKAKHKGPKDAGKDGPSGHRHGKPEPAGSHPSPDDRPAVQGGAAPYPPQPASAASGGGFMLSIIGTAHADPGDGAKAEKHDKDEKPDKNGISVRKVMKSLHTGKFLGPFDWIWADLIALSLFFFVLSGVVTWWRASRRAAGTGAGGG